jgi:hypothetical protein
MKLKMGNYLKVTIPEVMVHDKDKRPSNTTTMNLWEQWKCRSLIQDFNIKVKEEDKKKYVVCPSRMLTTPEIHFLTKEFEAKGFTIKEVQDEWTDNPHTTTDQTIFYLEITKTES